MTDKTVDFRTTRKTMPVPCFDNAYKSNRPMRCAKKSLPEDEISSMDVFSLKKNNNLDKLSPSKKNMMQNSDNMRPKRNLDSSNYLTKKFLYLDEKDVDEENTRIQKKRNVSIAESTKGILSSKKLKNNPFPEDENLGEWGTSSEGENIFESPKFTHLQNQDHIGKEEDDEETDCTERGNFEQAYLHNEDPGSDDPKMNFNYIYQGHPGHLVNHKEKIRYYGKADMVEQDPMDHPEKSISIQYADGSAEDLSEEYYPKRHSNENSKIVYNNSLSSSGPLDGSYLINKSSSSYSGYAHTSTVSNVGGSNNGHLFVGGANSRKRPTILKRNNANSSGNNGAANSSSTSSSYSSLNNSNSKVPPPMSRYPPPKFLTRQLVQMAAAAQRNPNNAAAVLSARKVLSSVPPQLAASVVNSVIAASQTTNSTPQVIQLATAVATSQQAAMASNDNMIDHENHLMSSYEDSRYQNQSSVFTSSKLSPNTVNSSQFSQPLINSQQQVQNQVTASDKLFGKKISGKYLPPPTSNIAYPSPIPSHNQISSFHYDNSQAMIGGPDHNSPAVRLNVGGKKLLVVGGAAKKIMSSMHNSGQIMHSMVSPTINSMNHDEKAFDEIQGYIPHESVEDSMKDFHTLEQNLVLDGQQIDINEH